MRCPNCQYLDGLASIICPQCGRQLLPSPAELDRTMAQIDEYLKINNKPGQTRIWSMLTDEGQPAPETALCAVHFLDERVRTKVLESVGDDVVVDQGFIDNTDDKRLKCIACHMPQE